MKVVQASEVLARDLCLAAECRADFDAIALRLGTQPDKGTFSDGSSRPATYRTIWLLLSTGRFVNVVQTGMRRSVVEFGLEIEKDQFFHQVDLDELVTGIGIDSDYVKRYRNEFTWLSD